MIQQMLFYTMFFSAVSTDLRPEGWECELWPSGEMCNKYMAFNRSYRYQLEQKQLFYNSQYDPRWWKIREVIDEVDWLYKAWDHLYWAQMNSSKYSETTRREYLRRLREYIGQEQYYQYRMPLPIPTNQFVEIEW